MTGAAYEGDGPDSSLPPYARRPRMNEEEAEKDALDAKSRLEWYEMAAEGRDYCGQLPQSRLKQNDKAGGGEP